MLVPCRVSVFIFLSDLLYMSLLVELSLPKEVLQMMDEKQVLFGCDSFRTGDMGHDR